MRSIIKRTLKLLDDPLHMVERKSCAIDVVLRDEDHPCLGKRGKLRPFRQLPRIHHAAVVACPTRDCAFIGTLNLAVVELPLAVFRQYVKANAPTIEIVRALLRDDVSDDEIVPPEKDAQQELHPFDIVVETDIEKRIVNQADLSNQRTIFRWNVLFDHPHRAYALLIHCYTFIVCPAGGIVKRTRQGEARYDDMQRILHARDRLLT